MKKIFFSIFLLSVIVAWVLFIDKPRFPQEGDLSPQYVVSGDTIIDLHSFSGKYVLVDFWSSADAQSRIKSNQYNAMSIGGDSSVARVSVNFDRSKRLFEEIVVRDKLNPDVQLHVNGADAGKVIRDFGLADGFRSYLIAPTGKIIAVNPDEKLLRSI